MLPLRVPYISIHLLVSCLLPFLLPIIFSSWFTKHSNETLLHSGSSLAVFLRFDGIHYWKNHYLYQPNHAFLPGYTTIVRIIKAVCIEDWLAIMLLMLINKLCFCWSAIEIRKIAVYLKQDPQPMFLAFVYNPAAIFFHTVYTESIFAAITFTAMRMCLDGQQTSKPNKSHSTIKTTALLMLATIFRSNAIFLSPLIGVPLLFSLYRHFLKGQYTLCLLSIFKGMLILLTIILPFLLYLIFSWVNICQSSYPPDVCAHYFNAYSYVQSQYWNVGFMRYYQWNNLLFIIIGMPAVVVAAYALAFYRPFTHVQQGLWLSFALLVLITVTVTNVQSATRFFAAHPVFYLGLLLLMKRFAIVKVVSLSYYFIGMFLYAVMFPWT